MFAAAFVFTNISFHQSLEIVAEGTQIYNLVSWNRQSRFSHVQIETLGGRVHLEMQERADDGKTQFAMPFAPGAGVAISVLKQVVCRFQVLPGKPHHRLAVNGGCSNRLPSR